MSQQDSSTEYISDSSLQYQSFEGEAQYMPQSSQLDNVESFNGSSFSTQTSTQSSNQSQEEASEELRYGTQDFYLTSQDIFSSSQFNSSQNTLDDENNKHGG